MNMLLAWPMFCLILLTCLVLMLLPVLRLYAMHTKKAHIRDFKYGDTEQVPELARLVNCNYRNLLELPVLFYATCLLLMSLDAVTEQVVNLAWVYVILRVIHSVIHIGYNNVTHRFLAFGLSFICLLLLIFELFQALMVTS